MNEAPPEWRSRKYLRMLPIELLKTLCSARFKPIRRSYLNFIEIGGEFGDQFNNWVLSSPGKIKDHNFEQTHRYVLGHIWDTLIHPATRALAPEILKEQVKAQLVKKATKS